MKFGDYRVEVVSDCEFRLDGGAMFGVVPRSLWSKACQPDEQNRIRMNMNCLFIEGHGERILIDTGIGDKWSDRHRAMYGIDRKQSFDESLRNVAGVGSEAITIVINTHLHFDHAGGNTILSEPRAATTDATVGNPVATAPSSDIAVPQFSNARYFVSKSELDAAENPHERDRASYLPDNWRPMQKSGQLDAAVAPPSPVE